MNRLLLTIITLMVSTLMWARHYDLSAVRLSTADGLPTNIVNRVWQDSIGFIWIETSNGLCRYDGYSVVQVDDSVRRVSTRSLQLRTREAEWVRTSPGRLERQISKLKSQTSNLKPQQWQLIPDEVIAHTRNDHFQVADVDGRTEAISTYGGGLFLLDKPTGEMTQVNSGVIDTPYLTGLFVDRTGCIWVIEDYLGVKCLQIGKVAYQRHLLDGHSQIQDANHVRCLTAYDDMLLVGTQDGRLFHYDAGTHQPKLLHFFTHRVYAAHIGGRASKPASGSDGPGLLWIGTRGGGLFCDGQKIGGLPSDDIYSIREDKDGSLWVAMLHGGVARIGGHVSERANDGVVTFGNVTSYLPGKDCHDLAHDSDGRWWVAAEDSLYTIEHGKATAITAGYFVCLCLDKTGHVWAGGIGGGIMDCQTKKRYTLANNNVYCITADRQGRIWAGTEEGLSCIDPATGSIRNHTFTDSPLANLFNERTALCLPDGRLVFGTHDGLLEIEDGRFLLCKQPEVERKMEDYSPQTAITSLYVNGSQSDLSPLISHLLPLNHSDNNITFSFSNFQYAQLKSVLYQYRLDGYDSDWSQPSAEHTATYRHLPPGHYTLRVRSCVDGQWGKAATLEVKIHQPWWNTWWAWLLYIIILTGTGWTAFAVVRRQLRLRRQIEVQRQVNAFQRDFYDRIERELRNPLNVVQGAAENVQLGGTTKTTVQSLKRGSRRVKKLMEMIREFHGLNDLEMQRKVEEDAMSEEAEQRFKDIQQTIREGEPEFRELAPPPINTQTVLLIVADDDSRMHLRDIINPYFRVVDIAAFEQTATAVNDCQPDLVLMDVTPGEHEAMELTRQLLEKRPTLPVIHLSTFDDEQHQLRSLRSGAVDYITLPVGNKVLVERIKKSLTTPLSNRRGVGGETVLTDVKDKKFLDQMQLTLSAHIADENFSVEQWAELMGLGRTQFYKKVKTLTGETPVGHLQHERLDYAARLLRETRLTVEEIMLRAGYHNATHFYNSFKKQFGVSPKNMRT